MGVGTKLLAIAHAHVFLTGTGRHETTRFEAPSDASSKHSSACGLVKWCYSAAALARLPSLQGKAEVVIFSNAPEADLDMCQPSPRLIGIRPELEADLVAWGRARSNATGRSKKYLKALDFGLANLYKWEAFRHTEYSSILLTDTDVDFFTFSAGLLPRADSDAGTTLRYAWEVLFPRFLASSTQLVATGDSHGPINAAVLLLKPSLRVYELGRAALQSRRWSPEAGFNESGPPSKVFPRLPSGGLHYRMRQTRMWHADTWNVITGDGDQGLLVHVFLVALRGETFQFASPLNRRRPNASSTTWTVQHFFWGHKPWRAKTRCAAYFDFMANDDFAHRLKPPVTGCLAVLDEKRRCLEPGLSPATHPERCQECKRLGQKSTCTMPPACPSDAWIRVF